MNSRRSQSRRSSNLLPIRPLFSKVNTNTSLTASSSKRASSIPRASFSSNAKLNQGRSHESLVSMGTTPSKTGMASMRMSATTPQRGMATPQSYGRIPASVAKKETRNLKDKTCTKEMMQNLANVLSDFGYPEFVGIKEIQKIDKQNFIKYFNFLFQYIDRSYQLTPRFDAEVLMKTVKDLGYCGSISKSSLMSIGAMHTGSLIIGLLSWLSDLVRKLMHLHEDNSLEMEELQIMTDAYQAWCLDQPYEQFTDDFRALYMERHQIEEGAVEEMDRQIRKVVEEYKNLERRSSNIDELKADARKLEQRLEDLRGNEVQLQRRFKELDQEEKHLLRNLEETKEKNATIQVEIGQLELAAKDCKLSVEEARKIRSEINAIRSHISSCSEQRAEVAKLVEKRELQIASLSAENIKTSRCLNLELISMGLISSDNIDWKNTLLAFLENKPKELSMTENHCLAILEKKERILAETSRLNMELKHTELQKRRLDDEFESTKTERDEMERLYLSQLSQLENISAAPRSDPVYLRNQYEIDSLTKKVAEQKCQMNQQEKDLEIKMNENAKKLKDTENEMLMLQNQVTTSFSNLIDGYKRALIAAEERSLPFDKIQTMLPVVNF